jgi:RNA polymerase sigma-70 factor (ECF subfamily)
MSDLELVAQSQQGDAEAFNSLVRRWDGSLFHFVRRMMGNDEDARDVCQETLVKAYVNIGRLRDPAKFKAWLHHIALNLCRDWHRSPKARIVALRFEEDRPDEARHADSSGTGRAPDRRAETAGLARMLSDVLAELPLEQRTSILLRECQGFTSEEIGQIMGVPSATVRTRIYYGLKLVRRLLRQRGITRDSL